jgi:hypothetical protein
MCEKFYFIYLALKGQSLLALSNNFIVSKNGLTYTFWYFEKPFGKLVNIGVCYTQKVALFRWKVLMKEVIECSKI